MDAVKWVGLLQSTSAKTQQALDNEELDFSSLLSDDTPTVVGTLYHTITQHML